jgi:ribosomal protein S18 acetylase RimI-like enzyme
VDDGNRVGRPTIRESATQGEAAGLAALLEIARPGAWSEERLRSELAREDVRCAWLGEGGRPVAVAFGRIVVDELHVFEVATAPDRRRRGAGTRVLEALLAAARRAGCRSALLELRASNGPAEALYASAGFVVVGRRPRYYPDGEDATLMTRPLVPREKPARPA